MLKRKSLLKCFMFLLGASFFLLACGGAEDEVVTYETASEAVAVEGEGVVLEKAPVPAPESAEESSKEVAPSTAYQSGILTAGDVDDNLNFSFFLHYISNMLDMGIGQELASAQPHDRVTLRFLDENEQALSTLWLEITPTGGQSPIVTNYTASDGTFYFFPSLDGAGDATQFQIEVRDPNQDLSLSQYTIDLTQINGQEPLDLIIPEAPHNLPEALDLMLVIDTTGSMTDELNYLIAELKSIVGEVRAAHPQVSIRFGLVVYRDEGDQYVVRSFDFTDSLDEMQDQLSKQRASGGGDYPEAMDQALATALEAQWRDGNTARMLFLVADAPPHTEKMMTTFEHAQIARQKDISIFPLAASGVADEAEYIMRLAAVITQGRYLFLTDDSGVGNSHAEPKIACYVITRLDNLMVRVIASELSGTRVEASEDGIIRQTGIYDRGACILEEQPVSSEQQ